MEAKVLFFSPSKVSFVKLCVPIIRDKEICRDELALIICRHRRSLKMADILWWWSRFMAGIHGDNNNYYHYLKCHRAYLHALGGGV